MFCAAARSVSRVRIDGAQRLVLCHPLRASSPSIAATPGSRRFARLIPAATAPGATAADGDGRNSPFAAALVKQIGQKGAAIEAVFRGVRREVVDATGGQQTPWDSSSLLDPFYFVP